VQRKVDNIFATIHLAKSNIINQANIGEEIIKQITIWVKRSKLNELSPTQSIAVTPHSLMTILRFPIFDDETFEYNIIKPVTQKDLIITTFFERVLKSNKKIWATTKECDNQNNLFICEQKNLIDASDVKCITNIFCLKNATCNYHKTYLQIIFDWNDDCQKSFEILKQKLIDPVTLDYPDFSRNNHFILTTDASKIGLGAVLANSNGRPVAYASRTLNKAEKNYSTTDIELLAIVWAVQKYRPYVFGRYFEIYTDHRPLVYLFSQADPSSRLNKFRMVLMEYIFSITYLKGKDNAVADALSRINIEELNEITRQIENSKVLVVTRSKAKQGEQSKSNMEKPKEKPQENPKGQDLITPKSRRFVRF
jgi:RNase H-like domain found in reverse transcriptase/Gypsy protein